MEKYILFSEFSTTLKVQEFMNEGYERDYKLVSISSFWVDGDSTILRVKGVTPVHYDVVMELKDDDSISKKGKGS